MKYKYWFGNKIRWAMGIQEVIEATAERFEAEIASVLEIIKTQTNELAEIRRMLDLRDSSQEQLQDLAGELRFAYQDIASILTQISGIPLEGEVRLETEHPVATDSDDHLYPRGTASDNTRYPRFCQKLEEIYARKIDLLDLGCAGGGLVWDFLLRGHLAVGLEGSDYS